MDTDGLDPSLERGLDEKLCPPLPGDAELLARVKARVFSAVASEARPAFRTVRHGSGEWVRVAAGVERKRLWTAGGAASWMLRLAPGAAIAPHDHPADEECVVLEGTLRIGDLLLHAGDFHVGRQGTSHGQLTTTDTGAVIFVRGAEDGAD